MRNTPVPRITEHASILNAFVLTLGGLVESVDVRELGSRIKRLGGGGTGEGSDHGGRADVRTGNEVRGCRCSRHRWRIEVGQGPRSAWVLRAWDVIFELRFIKPVEQACVSKLASRSKICRFGKTSISVQNYQMLNCSQEVVGYLSKHRATHHVHDAHFPSAISQSSHT